MSERVRRRFRFIHKVKMFLRRIARPLMMAAKVKETTGIVGLEVVPNAREVLINLYRKTLDEIKAVPEDEGYRKAVESFTRHRLNVCIEEEDWELIEKKLGCGQVEELIEEARDELKLIGYMNGSYVKTYIFSFTDLFFRKFRLRKFLILLFLCFENLKIFLLLSLELRR